MKPTMQLTLTNQLTLTPQLQQAIRLLQLSTLDLRQEIQQKLESNPLLDVSNPEEIDDSCQETLLEKEDEFSDFQWSTLYKGQTPTNQFNENEYIFETLHCTRENLQDSLIWQLDLTPMTDIDRVIAAAIIDAINDDGFLTVDITEIQKNVSTSTHPVQPREVEAVLHRIQRFDPVGCGARNLAETLIVQLDQLKESIPYLKLTKQIITKDIKLIGQHNYKQLMKTYRINRQTLEKVLANILRLNPKPGNVVAQAIPGYVTPDLSVIKKNGEWQVTLTPRTLPKLHINHQYKSMIKRGNNHSENQFLKSNLKEARWFLKSIQSRQETLLKVGQFIVDYQKEFLEFGENAMRPLILNDVARELDMHESTISRVTTSKYIHTPQGMFELKFFFSSNIPTASGEACSSIAIRSLLKKLLASENPQKPLSDCKLSQLFADKGINIARRTISKYREELNIPPSYERKKI